MDDSLYVLVKTRDAVLFEGQAKAVTSFNEVGEFDVLASHSNFISLVKKSVVIHDTRGEKHQIEFANALMKVNENRVNVYLGIEKLAPTAG